MGRFKGNIRLKSLFQRVVFTVLRREIIYNISSQMTLSSVLRLLLLQVHQFAAVVFLQCSSDQPCFQYNLINQSLPLSRVNPKTDAYLNIYSKSSKPRIHRETMKIFADFMTLRVSLLDRFKWLHLAYVCIVWFMLPIIWHCLWSLVTKCVI